MKKINKEKFKHYIENFDFTTLFNQLGWTYLDQPVPVKLKDETYLFHSVAEKGGFHILIFHPSKHQDLPTYATRMQLDRKIGKLFREHLIIFCDKNKTTQIWQLFVKQFGKPSRLSETHWRKGQEPELLYQKTSNLFFTLDQEENITISDVVDAVNENFSKNVEQVTKKFYENFKKEHKKFIEFITGITTITDREWYASLMLNRLMFCYFIQKKGFLDNNLNYLKDKLNFCQQKKGKDKFYVSFYKNFLLALFHQGLGSPVQSEELKQEIGKIPYLNGGLFDVHELEKQYENIDISDKAFENIFYFFDQYNWHLDTRISASGKDINPDVIGYIFEKYINDRAQMGAYYTKEDITDYISKNCIIPFLFDETIRSLIQYQGRRKTEDIFTEIGEMLRESSDEYIYDAVKYGINTENEDLFDDLPEEIKAGFRPDIEQKIVDESTSPHLWEMRKVWNQQAPENIALPTEIYRELIDRRKRYAEIRYKIENGEITHINDFVTYNLNIRQFAQDVIDSNTSPEFIFYFYATLSHITIIDPTCGSGAFLFAAMNILEPLYESCIQRMENFVAEAPKGKYPSFEKILKNVKSPEHPNLKYFIFKSIILNNLYGVDIMKEAVEIAKLRLFLKLIATVEVDYKKPNLGLEPLPDIDFNIRAGNTLVGFATENDIDNAFVGNFDFDNDAEKIKEKCDIVARTFARYKEIQLQGNSDFDDFKIAKDKLNNRLKELNQELNQLLHKQATAIPYDKWLQTHQPFHWFAEFYEIIHHYGGFDVIIGNPPYVEYSKVKKDYTIKEYYTESCGNLYAFCSERSLTIKNNNGNIGLIIPLSIVSGNKFWPLRKLLNKLSNTYYSHYDIRPSKLFDGVDQRLTIFLKLKSENENLYSTKFNRWEASVREVLFNNINFVKYEDNADLGFAKIGSKIEKSAHQKLQNHKLNFSHYSVNKNENCFYFRSAGGRYYLVLFNEPQKTIINNIESKITAEKPFFLHTVFNANIATSIISSNLFYLYYLYYSDARNLTKYLISSFPITKSILEDNTFITLCDKLMISLKSNSVKRQMNKSNGDNIILWEIYPKFSKPIIDEIDTVLAEHYGFTEEELDFIINYDIKYRMGKELENEKEE